MSENQKTCQKCGQPIPTPEKHLHERAEAAINGLRAEGIDPTLDEVVWLNDVARELDSGSPLSAGIPYRAGDSLWLWPFTIQGAAWYARVLDWYAEDEDGAFFALAYALAYGRQSGAFYLLQDAVAARKQVDSWKRVLRCTVDELTYAIRGCLSQDDSQIRLPGEEIDGFREPDWGAEIADIIEAVGGTPQQWECEVTRAYFNRQIAAVNRQRMAVMDDDRPSQKINDWTRKLGRVLILIRRAHAEGEHDGE